jgi:hypothetical protein
MATYREIHGKAIKTLSSDPSAETNAGQIWYNTTSDTFKTIVKTSAWSSAAPISTARSNAGGFGIQTANVIAGGSLPSGKTNLCEEYNGSGWATGGVLNTTRGELSGVTSGTLTAGLMFGGNTAPGWNGTTATEEYNGTAWTSVNNMATTVSFMGGSGIQTAAFSAGGRVPANTNNSQEYDGTNWSNGNPINTARQGGVGTGIQTAGLYCGGEASGASADVESYDGTTWTEGPNLGTARYRLGGGGDTQNTSMVFAGSVPGGASKVLTELYDGTSWSETADMGSTAKEQVSGFRGPNTAGIATGGYINSPPGWASTSEEFNQGTNVITAAAWAAGGTLNTARSAVGRSGIAPTQNAALCVSGYPGPPSSIDVKNVEEYNGTSWTEVGDVNSSRYRGICAGTTAAGLFFGGNSDVTPGTKPLPLSEEWDGSSWTAGNTMQNGNEAGAGLGTQTAALQAGGSLNPYPNYTNTAEEYNGTSWSDVPATIFASVSGVTGVGTQTAGLIFCGNEAPPPGTNYANAQTYNGTSFTSVNSCLESGNGLVGGGTQTAAFGAGGGPGAKSRVQHYDGTSWSTVPSLGTGRNNASGGAPQTAGIYFAGTPGSGSPGATEEYTEKTTAVNVKTLTQS